MDSKDDSDAHEEFESNDGYDAYEEFSDAWQEKVLAGPLKPYLDHLKARNAVVLTEDKLRSLRETPMC